MARTNNLPEYFLRGKIGNVVFVQNGDQVIVRAAQAKRKKESWSEKQQQHRSRFKAVIDHYQQLKNRIVSPIWDLAATHNLTSYNLFLKANLPAFDNNGVLSDFSLLHYSIGSLPLPQRLSAVREESNPQEILISWNTELITKAEMPNDELLYVLVHGEETLGPVATGARRSDGMFRLQCPDQTDGESCHLYLFFSNQARSHYSEDKYFLV